MGKEKCPVCEEENFQLLTLRIECCKGCGRTVFDLSTACSLSAGSINVLKILLTNIQWAMKEDGT